MSAMSLFESESFEHNNINSFPIFSDFKNWSIRAPVRNRTSHTNPILGPAPVVPKSGSKCQGQVTRAFLPHHLILLFIGRFPFPLNGRDAKDNGFTKYFLEPFYWLYFILTTLALSVILVNNTLGFANYFLDWDFLKSPDHDKVEGPDGSTNHDKELQLFNDNSVAFVLFWGCLVHVTVSNVSFLLNRRKISAYFQRWNEAVAVMGLDLPASLRRFLIVSNVGVLCFVVAVVIFYVTQLVQLVPGISNLIILLTLRLFYSVGIHAEIVEEFSVYSILGLVTTLYVIYASRAIIFIFTFKCRLLRHCFKEWNGRLKRQLQNLDRDESTENAGQEMSASEKLFADHCVLIRMVKRTDRVFAGTLQSYYLTQVMNMCFELYYLARSGCSSQSHGLPTETDILAAFILIFQTFFIFFTVSLEAAHVSEEAMKGYQLLRTRGLKSTDSTDKKYLIQNLFVSYSHNIVLTGGRFFAVDKPFIIRVLGAVFTYFVIILQFGPEIGDGCGYQSLRPKK